MLFTTFSAYIVHAEETKILGTLTINVGETKPLKFTDPNGNTVRVIWECSDPDIATVDDAGNVTGKKEGVCIISTYWNSNIYGVNIVVNKSSSKNTTKKATAKKKVSISKTKLTLKKGKTATLKLNNAKASKVKWSSSNKNIATVSSKGVVTAKKAGTATITAKYSGKKYTCKVTVSKSAMTKKQAFDKLVKYLKKNGKKQTDDEGTFYYVTWSNGGTTYEISYSYYGDIQFQANSYINGEFFMGNLFWITKGSNKAFFNYYGVKNGKEYAACDNNNVKMSSFNLKKGITYEYMQYTESKPLSLDEVKKQADSFLQWTFPDFNSYITKNAKVSMKQLGYTNWDK